MKIGAADLLTLAAGLAVGVAVVVAIRKLQGLADSAASAPGQVLDAIGGAIGEAVDYVASIPGAVIDGAAAAVIDARQGVADSNPNNPGAGLPPGWYKVKTRFGEVITRHPDSFKTINPYDTLGLIDP